MKKAITAALMSALMTYAVTANAEPITGTVTADALNVRSMPTTESQSLGLLPYGSSVELSEQIGSWYKIDFMDQVGYIFGSYIKTDSDAALPEQNETQPENAENKAALSAGENITEIAKQYIGTPYRYGGTTPSGFDCSGFVQYVYAKAGISLPRTSYTQAAAGTYVCADQLMPGDIVCFGGSSIGHVGIYVGDGMFIHSPSSGKTVCISPLSGSYGGRFQYGRRIVTN